MTRRWKIPLVLLGCLLAAPLAWLCVAAATNGRTGVSSDLSQSTALQAPPPVAAPIALKVVTFNIQDLYLVGKDRPRRMRAIGAKLYTLDPDVVAFQEAFIEADRNVLLKELESSRLQYHQYYASGTVGSGLLIASAFPIREVFFHQYTVANPAYKLWEGDWWAGKGVALARLELPDGGLLDFYNTHAQAGYGNPAYDVVREQQMNELADFIKQSHCPTAVGLVAGDMNCRPGDADFAAAVNGAGLQRVMLGESRIDHIFAIDDHRYTYLVEETVPIEDLVKLGETVLSLSDHKGYLSALRIQGQASDVPAAPVSAP